MTTLTLNEQLATAVLARARTQAARDLDLYWQDVALAALLRQRSGRHHDRRLASRTPAVQTACSGPTEGAA